ncbi:DUF3667 domain-containing protein [Hymenobacter algoricola]|uniref:DUF3667 domain-containing protein n=1 Tax=Hymenobacter algoricola TaxID=486267 RepID=A0ABP7NUM0_9BACT
METVSPTVLPVPEPAVLVGAPAIPACVSCGTALAGPYCHICGEKRLHRHDYALKHFLEHAVDTVTHFDLRDLWQQLRRPGWLAAEWLRGRRVRHAPPVQLFLITNLLFYLLASVSHFSPFDTQLQYHFASNNGYGGLAKALVAQHLQETGIWYTAFAREFDALAHGYSKSLVFLFIPLLAGPLWLLFRRQRRYFVEWLVLSTYLFGGMLLVFALMALLSMSARVVRPLLFVFTNDDIIAPFMLALTIAYAAGFFRTSRPGSAGAKPCCSVWVSA